MLGRLGRAALVLQLLARAALADAPSSQLPPATVPSERVEPANLPRSQIFVKDTHAIPELLQFSGNLVFNDFTYRALLNLPRGSAADARTARRVVLQLTRFLKSAGYELARVQAHPDGQVLRITIDEGHLDRVVITGESALNSIRLRLQLQQPFDVFNRPELEARLRALSKRMGLTDASYQLVKTKDLPENTPRIFEDTDALQELRDAGLLSEPGVYELHISIRQGTWGKGFSPEVVIGGLDGLGAGGVFRGSRLLPIDDRWEARVRGGVASLPSLNGQGSELVLSRALGELHYWSAPLLGQTFRPGLLLSSDLLEQSRRDLGYDLFRRETLQAALGVGDTLSSHLFTAAGLGVQARWFWDLDDPTQSLTPLQPSIPRQVRPLFLATLRYTVEPDQLRHDFRNPVFVVAQVFRDQGQFSYRIDCGVEYAIPLGWHELRWDAHAFAIGGLQQFFDQATLSDYMQNEFNDVFTKHVVEVGWEYRYSLIRDQFKVGALAHALTFGELNQTAGLPEHAGFAVSVGLGAHALVWDAIIIDADLSIGRRAGAFTGTGLDGTSFGGSVFGGPAFSLNITQVY